VTVNRNGDTHAPGKGWSPWSSLPGRHAHPAHLPGISRRHSGAYEKDLEARQSQGVAPLAPPGHGEPVAPLLPALGSCQARRSQRPRAGQPKPEWNWGGAGDHFGMIVAERADWPCRWTRPTQRGLPGGRGRPFAHFPAPDAPDGWIPSWICPIFKFRLTKGESPCCRVIEAIGRGKTQAASAPNGENPMVQPTSRFPASIFLELDCYDLDCPGAVLRGVVLSMARFCDIDCSLKAQTGRSKIRQSNWWANFNMLTDLGLAPFHLLPWSDRQLFHRQSTIRQASVAGGDQGRQIGRPTRLTPFSFRHRGFSRGLGPQTKE